MRIIGGKYRSKKFTPPKNIPTRPTTDIAKEGLFNVLNNYWNFENVRFLDLFGGTGSISYEFASRGCQEIDCVEIFPKCAKYIEKMADEMNLNQLKVHQQDVFDYVQNCGKQYDLIFAGPPYPLKTLDTLPDVIFENDVIDGPGWFILEHNSNHNFENHPHYFDVRNYGGTIFSIFNQKGEL